MSVPALPVATPPSPPFHDTDHVLRDIVRCIPGTELRSVRDRALLAFGMAGAFRRSALPALRLPNVEWIKEGPRVIIRR